MTTRMAVCFVDVSSLLFRNDLLQQYLYFVQYNAAAASLLFTVEVSLLPTCAVDDARIRAETLNLLSGGRYVLRDGGPLRFV